MARQTDLNHVLQEAVAQTARELQQSDLGEVAADGSDLLIRSGRYLFAVENTVQPASSGNREQMLEHFAGMVVRHLIGRAGDSDDAGACVCHGRLMPHWYI